LRRIVPELVRVPELRERELLSPTEMVRRQELAATVKEVAATLPPLEMARVPCPTSRLLVRLQFDPGPSIVTVPIPGPKPRVPSRLVTLAPWVIASVPLPFEPTIKE